MGGKLLKCVGGGLSTEAPMMVNCGFFGCNKSVLGRSPSPAQDKKLYENQGKIGVGV